MLQICFHGNQEYSGHASYTFNISHIAIQINQFFHNIYCDAFEFNFSIRKTICSLMPPFSLRLD